MGSLYTKAVSIYEATKDMDFGDYEENYDSDISYIMTLIENIGYSDTLKLLNEYCFG